MSEPEHVITVESTQIYRGEVTIELAEELTHDGTRRNILGDAYKGVGPELDFSEETELTFECSCGRRFRKGKTAREHLEGASSNASNND